jgi:O-antigen ligase
MIWPASKGAAAAAPHWPERGVAQPTIAHVGVQHPSPGLRRNPATVPVGLWFSIALMVLLSITVTRESDGDGSAAQTGIRVVAYAAAALAVLFALGTRRLRLNFPMLAWTAVAIFISLSAIYSLDPTFSFTAGLVHLTLLWFAWNLVERHGRQQTALVVVVAGALVGGLSIVIYYYYPELGVSSSTRFGEGLTGRMRGLTSQPNVLGSISALTMLIGVMHFQAFTLRQRALVAFAAVIAAFCLIYSDSRTSMAAVALCLAMWWLCRVNPALNLFALLCIALSAVAIYMFVPDFSSFLTRGDDGTSDLASLNGRSRIWAVAWEYIHASPIIGHGYGASRLLLPIDDRLFGAAVNSHNVYMEVLFSGGVILLGLFILATGMSIIRCITRRRIEALIILLFFLIRGVAEAAPFGGLPLFATLVFYIAVAMSLASQPAQQRAARRVWGPSAAAMRLPRHPALGAAKLQR